MDYNDQFLYKHIKRLQAQVDMLNGQVGAITSSTAAAGGSVYEGTDDPNVSLFTPTPLTKPAMYNQVDGDGNNVATFWWHVASQAWL